MKTLLRATLITAVTLPFAFGQQPFSPKRVADFPDTKEIAGLAIGARLLSEEDAKDHFFADVHKTFKVVEVALEPRAGSIVEVERKLFALRRLGDVYAVESAAPAKAAEMLQLAAATAKSVKITPRSETTYRTGPDPTERTAGRLPDDPRNQPGIYNRYGVDVTWERGSSGATEGDRKVMEAELQDKELPQGRVEQLMYGYLYFPFRDSKDSGQFRLELEVGGQTVKLDLTQ